MKNQCVCVCVLRIMITKDKILLFSNYNVRICNFLYKLAAHLLRNTVYSSDLLVREWVFLAGQYVWPKTKLEIFFGFFHVMQLTVNSMSASYQSTELSLGNRVLEKLIVVQVLKNVSPSVLLEGSLPYSQETAIGSYPKSGPHPYIQYFINTLNIILHPRWGLQVVFFLSGF
jgi:hypothetical protein